MKKLVTAVLVVFAMTAFSLAPAAFACGKGGDSKCSECAYKEKTCKVTKLKKEMTLYWAYADELKLTEDQLSKLGDVKHAALKKLILETAEVKAIAIDVKTEMWASQIDLDAVNPLIDAKYAAKNKVAKTYVKALADAQSILTAEQRNKMKEIKGARYIKESGVMGSECSGKFCPLADKKH